MYFYISLSHNQHLSVLHIKDFNLYYFSPSYNFSAPSTSLHSVLHLDSLGLDQALDLSDRIVQDLLLQLLVLERVLHLLDHRSGQLALLLLPLARLETNPRVEHRLDLGGERRLLSKFKHLLLGLSRLLGHRVESLGETDNILLRLYRVDARLDRFGVLGACAVEDLGNFL